MTYNSELQLQQSNTLKTFKTAAYFTSTSCDLKAKIGQQNIEVRNKSVKLAQETIHCPATVVGLKANHHSTAVPSPNKGANATAARRAGAGAVGELVGRTPDLNKWLQGIWTSKFFEDGFWWCLLVGWFLMFVCQFLFIIQLGCWKTSCNDEELRLPESGPQQVSWCASQLLSRVHVLKQIKELWTGQQAGL